MNNKIIEKIQAILARADEGRNDNENEREIAMRQANALLVKHGLSMTDITDQTERAESFGKLGRVEVALTTSGVWEAGVFNEIARLNGCQVVRASTGKGRKKSVWIIGRQLNCSTTRYMAEYVVSSVKRQAKIEGFRVVPFGVGAWTGVSNQVDSILKAQAQGIVDGEKLEESTALMVVNQHQLAVKDSAKAMREFFPRTRSSGYGYSGSRDGVSAGKAYGQSINLNKQVGGQKAIGQ